ncbi:2'-5' RNA ligase family protein [Phenylobacterium sp.]|uniref:2'-5' RNA ligase family protein n=1 Tax=Phenylobacterium sp. TaxID=1871053 RepID=UPI002C0534AA|nr:2'-5' RNA ligase family protein [Phenylobacterium sp.]HLZ76360.1 2'-5' RNA ligase family protein [Phenylobacterium sp.]
MTLLFEDATPAGDEAPHNLYFALRPDAEAARALCALESLRAAPGRPMDPDRLHISLYSLGLHRRWPRRQIVDAVQAVGSVRRTPFLVELDRIATWGRGLGPLPVVAWSEEGVVGVHGLHEVLHQALAGTADWRRRKPGIEPHLTLWRDHGRMPETFIAPIRWRVREFVLIDSRYGQGRHELVDRFPLTG